eukprot:10322089-Heterocapsa_arctica.AAC.1
MRRGRLGGQLKELSYIDCGELGVQAPVGSWDPTGFCKDGDVEDFKRRGRLGGQLQEHRLQRAGRAGS